ncbi:MAG: hypothetical protein GY828_06990 [Candidatus Gracilibacteria bacterium]|nr:hypothetical protein [Candidatus Gracilibacteria bacterium]
MKKILLLLLVIATLSSCTGSIQEKQLERVRDSSRIADLNLIKNALGIYYSDNNEYPININDLIEFLPRIPQDPKHGETIKGKVFQYVYETVKNDSGIITEYRLSTYLESERNSKRALEDQGIYDDKFELFE